MHIVIIRIFRCYILLEIISQCVNSVTMAFQLCRYWTDNGACYYYTTINFSNYEEALVAVKAQADKEGIPYRYLQVTS